MVEALEEGGVDIAALRVDGKPTENGFLMQFQADISGKTIVKNAVEEASAFGSALMAGLATGFWQQADIPGADPPRGETSPANGTRRTRAAQA